MLLLLDTINHVLDFSKINSFENSWLEVCTPEHSQVNGVHSAISEGTAASTESRSGALLNIYAKTNVAAICEEVVEGLCAGQVRFHRLQPMRINVDSLIALSRNVIDRLH